VAATQSWSDRFRLSGVSAKDVEYIAPAFLPESFFFEEPPEDSYVLGRRSG
jgi:serine/threonine-protein kinase HipA